jgi:hypothetical protein
LGKNGGAEHEGAAGEEAQGRWLAQQKDSSYGAEEALGGEEDGGVRRRRPALGHDLKRECHSAGKYSP